VRANTPLGPTVSRETADRLIAYHNLLSRWSTKINLVSPAVLPNLLRDDLPIIRFLADQVPYDTNSIIDLGSGGGLPGIILSILRPDTVVTLIEADQRKSAFLRTAVRELSLNADVRTVRIEEMPPLHGRVVTARALAPLPKLLGYVARHLHRDGLALLPKGARYEREIGDAQAVWTFDHDVIQAPGGGAILRLRNIEGLSGGE
jgi:16S rRNA (guanine527-N7)-methyltransferase